jgi:hypothetical protein
VGNHRALVLRGVCYHLWISAAQELRGLRGRIMLLYKYRDCAEAFLDLKIRSHKQIRGLLRSPCPPSEIVCSFLYFLVDTDRTTYQTIPARLFQPAPKTRSHFEVVRPVLGLDKSIGIQPVIRIGGEQRSNRIYAPSLSLAK